MFLLFKSEFATDFVVHPYAGAKINAERDEKIVIFVVFVVKIIRFYWQYWPQLQPTLLCFEEAQAIFTTFCKLLIYMWIIIIHEVLGSDKNQNL